MRKESQYSYVKALKGILFVHIFVTPQKIVIILPLGRTNYLT